MSGRKTGEKRRLDTDPDQLKLNFALWNRIAAQQLIEHEYGVEIPIRTVRDNLKRWDFTPQKQVKFAMDRKQAKVKQWLTNTYPALSGRAKAEGAEIYWGEETDLRASDVRGRGYATKGKTPVIRATVANENLRMVSAITNRGKVNWMIVDGTNNAEHFIELFFYPTYSQPSSSRVTERKHGHYF